MMSPVYLISQASNSFPLMELKEEHHHHQQHLMKIFLSSPSSPQNKDSSSFNSLPCPTQEDPSGSQFLRDQPQVCLIDKVIVDQHLIPHGGSISSSDHHTSEGHGLSSFACVDQGSDQEISSHHSNNNNNNNNSNNSLGIKWMSSKMRIIHKMKKNGPNNCPPTREWSWAAVDSTKRLDGCDHQDVRSVSTSNGSVRVCSDCNTTTTPLWRSGPLGPKSLCNACGIRQRKARRAMEAAAAAATGTTSTYNTSSRSTNNNFKPKKNKLDKKPRPNKNHHNKIVSRNIGALDSSHNKKHFVFENFMVDQLSENSSSSGYGRVYAEDKAEAAALLLMEISRGLLNHA